MTQLIELTPISDFFFGGEATFGEGENRNYFVQSNLWPQQTSLLGMLRYELLKSEPLAFDVATDTVTNPAEATALIGLKGFDGRHEDSFGIIEGISPVFLLNNNSVPYFLRSHPFLEGAGRTFLEKKVGFHTENPLSELLPANTNAYQLMQEIEVGGTTKAYDGKTKFEQMLVGAHGGKPVNVCDVFLPVHKTNNRKEYDGSTDDSGFFKQDLFRLASGWRFAFLAEFSEALPIGFGTRRQVQLGAERRHFILSTSQPTQQFEDIVFEENSFKNFDKLYVTEVIGNSAALTQIMLISDAKITPDIYQHTDFAISSSIPFRHFDTHLKAPNTAWHLDSNPKSSRQNLLQRSSIFFAQGSKTIEDKLLDAAAFRRIGYNYFKTITA